MNDQERKEKFFADSIKLNSFFKDLTEEDIDKNFIAGEDTVNNPKKRSSFPFLTREAREQWEKLNRYEAGKERKIKKEK